MQVLKLAAAATEASPEHEICVIYDFDCTLSSQHMFKALYQSQSRWAQDWARVRGLAAAGDDVLGTVAPRDLLEKAQESRTHSNVTVDRSLPNPSFSVLTWNVWFGSAEESYDSIRWDSLLTGTVTANRC